MSLPNLDYELDLWKQGYVVIGVDEVGRGAFAGPLFAAGVIFAPTLRLRSGQADDERITQLLSYGINDSKKLSKEKRELLAEIIQKEALAFSIQSVDVDEINRIGIGNANYKAMQAVIKYLIQSLRGTNKVSDEAISKIASVDSLPRDDNYFVLVDGSNIRKFDGVSQKSIIHGDGISLSIAAASIIAKVARDKYMSELSEQYADFGWDKNKGYGTLFHRQQLAKHGATPQHRTDFIERFI